MVRPLFAKDLAANVKRGSHANAIPVVTGCPDNPCRLPASRRSSLLLVKLPFGLPSNCADMKDRPQCALVDLVAIMLPCNTWPSILPINSSIGTLHGLAADSQEYSYLQKGRSFQGS